MPLLTLSADRIAREVRRAELNAAADRAEMRRRAFALLHACAWYVLGLLLVLASFHATGPSAHSLMLLGWLVGNVAPITILVVSSLRQQA